MLTTLIDVVRDLESLPEEATICAAKPWSETSQALIVAEADDRGMSSEAQSLGMAYFWEVFIAREFLECGLGTVAPNQRFRRNALDSSAMQSTMPKPSTQLVPTTGRRTTCIGETS